MKESFSQLSKEELIAKLIKVNDKVSLLHRVHEEGQVFKAYIDAKSLSYLYVNKSFSKIFGKLPEEIIGKKLKSVLGSKWFNYIKEHISKASQGIETEYENFFNLDKKEKRIKVKYAPDYAWDGKVIGIIITAFDITELYQKQKLISEKEAQHRSFIDNLPVAVFRSTVAGKLLSCNKAMAKMYGYSTADELLERPAIDFYTNPADRDLMIKALQKKGSGKNIITKEKKKDGSIVWINTDYSAIKNHKGEILYIDGVAEDITEKKKTEEAFIESEQTLRLAVQTAGLGLWDQNFRSGETHRSKSWYQMLGYKESSEKSNLNFWESIIHPDDAAIVEKESSKHELGKSDIFAIEHRLKCKNGEYKWIRNWGKIISRDENGKPLRAIGVHLDIDTQKKAQLKIIESEQKFRSIFNNINDPVIIHTLKGEILECNNESLKKYEYEPSEFKGINILDLEVNGREIAKNQFINIIDRKTQFAEGEHKTKSGKIISVEIQAKIISHLGQDAVMTVIRDITERKELIKRFRLSHSSVETANACIFWVTPEGQFFYVNETATKYLGYTKDDLEGNNIKKILPNYNEADRNNHWNNLKTNNSLNYETAFKTKNGKIFPVRVTDNYINFEGVEYEFAFAIDITQERAAKRTLIESEGRYRNLVENFPDGVIILSGSKILYVNNALSVLFGKESPNEIIGDDIYKYIFSDSLNGKTTLQPNTNNTTTNYTIESKYLTTEGSLKPCEILVSNVLYKGIPSIQLILRDLYERKKLENQEKKYAKKLEKEVEKRTLELAAQAKKLVDSQAALTFLLEDVNESRAELMKVNSNLESANQELESFSYTVSHDLRAPLRHIDGFTQLLENKISPKPPEISKYFDKIYSASMHMHSLINDLLTFSRLGRRYLKKSVVDLNLLINELLVKYEPDFKNRDIVWNIDKLHPIVGDFEMLKIAFDNLFSNALKFTSKNKNTIIGISSKEIGEDQIEIVIQDNGVGFEMEYIDKIFGVFERLHDANEFPGTGIGLANVKKIVDSHMGTIQAFGAPGKGATFTLKFPVIEPDIIPELKF
ncbi:MAG: PAS domain S-box protein [Bacteroidales bacterium]|nr:PAS domain S-box protein [Bacteroidales bacterium]MCF8404629.1 PAS domain S-box protein [Bacteroidales bacterium]